MGQVHHNSTIIREQLNSTGEITINLNLTIKLDSDGLKVSAQTEQQNFIPRPIFKKEEQSKDDELEMLIPDFEMGEMIDFGRKAD